VRRGRALLVGLLLSTLACPISNSIAEESKRPSAPLGIAPMEVDLVAMRQTLGRLNELVGQRQPEKINDLISPHITEPQQRAIVLAVEGFVASLPADSQFDLRTDIGRNAVVPMGPERVMVQVSSTTTGGREGSSRQRAPVSVQLQGVEQDGRRVWLISELIFPGQSPVLTGGFPISLPVAAGVVVLFLAAGGAAVIIRRRRARDD